MHSTRLIILHFITWNVSLEVDYLISTNLNRNLSGTIGCSSICCHLNIESQGLWNFHRNFNTLARICLATSCWISCDGWALRHDCIGKYSTVWRRGGEWSKGVSNYRSYFWVEWIRWWQNCRSISYDLSDSWIWRASYCQRVRAKEFGIRIISTHFNLKIELVAIEGIDIIRNYLVWRACGRLCQPKWTTVLIWILVGCIYYSVAECIRAMTGDWKI